MRIPLSRTRLWLVCGLLLSMLLTTDVPSTNGQGTWTFYGVEQGLPSERIIDIEVAADGTVWVTTPVGIASFDGMSWTTLPNTAALVEDCLKGGCGTIATAPDGTIWLYSLFPMHYDGADWTLYPTCRHERLTGSMAAGFSVALVANVEAPSFCGTQALPEIAITASGGLWAAPSGQCTCDEGSRPEGGLVWFEEENWSALDLPASMDGLAIESIAAAPDDSLWVMTRQSSETGGLWHYTGETWHNFRLPFGYWRTLAAGMDGTVWLASVEDGVAQFDGERWTLHTPADMGAGYAPSIAVAPDGTIWAGTNVGVSHFDGEMWTSYVHDAPDFSNPVFWNVAAAPDGSVWAGTRHGLYHVMP